MIKLTVKELAQAVEGTVVGGGDEALHREVEGLVWDSRQVAAGSIFLAMPGERVDGNDYVMAAIEAGAGAALITREATDEALSRAAEAACALIAIQDGTQAITRLAAWWRGRLTATVIGVTGSTGKTSTKDFLKGVCSQRFKTVATTANHNNEIGVPATVLDASLDTEVLIVEIGMRGLGQITKLCEMVQPSIAVVTNVGVSHMELLGSQDNIARAKSEMIQALPEDGLAVVNADDPFTPKLVEYGGAAARGIEVRSYGFSPDAFAHAEGVSFDEQARASFTLVAGQAEPVHIALPLPGRHNVSNALSAAVVGQYLGMEPSQIAAGLSQAQATGMRMEVVESAAGVLVVNDAYNASPDSMKASLSTLASMKCTGKRIAVLGDMGELGDNEVELHRATGRAAANSSLDLLVCVGSLATEIAAGALAEGLAGDCVKTFEDAAAAGDFVSGAVAGGDLVLVKASRFMGLERIVREIVE